MDAGDPIMFDSRPPVGTLPDEIVGLLDDYASAVDEARGVYDDCREGGSTMTEVDAARDECDAARARLDAALLPYVRDAERMDWLERKSVRVGTKLDVGTFVEWHALPEADEDGRHTLPSQLRSLIDAARSSTPGGDRA